MPTKSQSKIMSNRFCKPKSKAPLTERPNVPVDKLIVYLAMSEMQIVSEAIGKVSAEDLAGVHSAGTHTGRAIAAICRAWLKARAQ